MADDEIALSLVTGGLTVATTNVLSRYVGSKTATTGVSTNDAVNGPAGVRNIIAQPGLTSAPLAGAYFVKQPMARAALQGFGLGAGLHLVGQIIKGYVVTNAPSGTSHQAGATRSDGDSLSHANVDTVSGSRSWARGTDAGGGEKADADLNASCARCGATPRARSREASA